MNAWNLKQLPPEMSGVSWLPSELHPREDERIAAVRALHIMDSTPEPELDRISEVAAALCGVPYGSVNIIDAEEHFTASSYGAPRVNASRADSLCAMAILGGGVLHSTNATDDPRFAHKSFLRMVDPPIRLFAAAPVTTADGLPVGTLRVYGEEIGSLTPAQIFGLERLAELTMNVLAMRATAINLGGLALQDSLTGLANRRAFDNLAARRGAGEIDHAALAFIDLDGFKGINDHFGHATGDAVLIQTARRLEAVAGPGDVVFRVGGDEFVVLFASRSDLAQIDTDLHDSLAVPTTLAGHLHQLGASVGTVALSPTDALEDALGRADQLMYQDKQASRG